MIHFECDGCGKKLKAEKNDHGDLIKPADWYERRDKDGEQHACSRECVNIAAKKSGKTNVVLLI